MLHVLSLSLLLSFSLLSLLSLLSFARRFLIFVRIYYHQLINLSRLPKTRRLVKITCSVTTTETVTLTGGRGINFTLAGLRCKL